MDKALILKRLRAEESRLNALGVEKLSIFGSAARGDATDQSDIDIAVTLRSDFSHGGFDFFAKLETLRDELAIVLDAPVDLVAEPVSRPELRTQIERDRVIAFQ